MGRNHGWSIRRVVCRAASGAALVAGSAAPLIAHAYPAQANLSQFTPAATTGGIAAGTTVSTDFGRLLQGAARLEGSVATAARTVAVAASVSPAANAGRVIAAACFANPVLCTTGVGAVALGAWFLSSQIEWDSLTGQYVKKGPGQEGHVYFRAAGTTGPYVERYTKPAIADYLAAEACASQTGCLGSPTWSVLPAQQARWNDPNDGGSVQIQFFYKPCQTCADQKLTYNRVFSHKLDIVPGDPVPVTQTDMETHGDTKRLDEPAPVSSGYDSDLVLNASPVPVPVKPPVFERKREPLGEPYAAPGDLSGFRRDVLTIEGKPTTPDPLDVEATPETIVADDPSTPENEEEEADPEAPGEKPEDLCLLHPNSVGCTDVGTAPDDQVPTRDVTVDYTAETVGLPVGCPSPVAMGSLGVLTFDGACEAATTSKPFVIAFAALAAAMLMLAAIRKQ